jgi:CRISPR-associated endoribonuclease Cas6
MRIQIIFNLSGNKQILPFNYQYALSSWIYGIFAKSDKEFAGFLHSKGYRLETGKSFKLFSFSRLQFPKNTWKTIPKSDRMEIFARKAYLNVSFHLPETAQHFILGLFQEQNAVIGDKISKIEMKVGTVEVVRQPQLKDGTFKLKTQSPLVITSLNDKKKYEDYLSPVQDEYKRLFVKNILDKYAAACRFDGTENKGFTTKDVGFTCLTENPGSVLQRIKAYTPEETQVRGYMFDFEMKAPKEILEVGLNAGFGAMSSLGFGFCEVGKIDRI